MMKENNENVAGKLQWKLIVRHLYGLNHRPVITLTLIIKYVVMSHFVTLGPASFFSPTSQMTSNPSTPVPITATASGPSSLSGPPVNFGTPSSPTDPSTSPLSSVSKTPSSSPPASRTPLLRPNTSPIDRINGGSTGKSPLRSCHTNSDAVTHLRRLATATFVNSSPPNRSPTVVIINLLLYYYNNNLTFKIVNDDE